MREFDKHGAFLGPLPPCRAAGRHASKLCRRRVSTSRRPPGSRARVAVAMSSSTSSPPAAPKADAAARVAVAAQLNRRPLSVSFIAATVSSLSIGTSLWFALRRRALPAFVLASVSTVWSWLVLRWVIFARGYTSTLVSEGDMADETSRFARCLDVRVHYKAALPLAADDEGDDDEPPALSGRTTGAVLFHGFGASSFSFEDVLQPLARLLHGPVIAFDRPGFGLTERPRGGFEAYTSNFVSRIGAQLCESQLGAPRVLLGGHSLGAYNAALTATKLPRERVRALVLIAAAKPPPIAVASALSTASTENDGAETKPSGRMGRRWRLFVRSLARSLRYSWAVLLQALWVLLLPFLIAALRAAASSADFWQRGLRAAFHDVLKVDDARVGGYSRPNAVRGWDEGVLRFTWAQLGAAPYAPDELEQAEAVYDNVAKLRVPVLLLHGAKDRLISPSVSKRIEARLQRANSPCSLVILPNCGHIPHEEQPEEVVRAIGDFLQSTTGGADVAV